MPRRSAPDPLSLAIGQRVRELRQGVGLTLEKLAYESDLGSKGHLSNLERGLVRPTVHTLAVLAARLGVPVLDLVTFPHEDERQRLVDATRGLSLRVLRRLVAEVRAEVPVLMAAEPPREEPPRPRRRRPRSE